MPHAPEWTTSLIKIDRIDRKTGLRLPRSVGMASGLAIGRRRFSEHRLGCKHRRQHGHGKEHSYGLYGLKQQGLGSLHRGCNGLDSLNQHRRRYRCVGGNGPGRSSGRLIACATGCNRSLSGHGWSTTGLYTRRSVLCSGILLNLICTITC